VHIDNDIFKNKLITFANIKKWSKKS